MSTQTIFRVAHRKLPFSQIGNDMLRDKKLSIEARGALAMILTYPPDWQFNLKWLCDMANVGRDQGRRIVKELEKRGYCLRRQIRKADGTLGYYDHAFTDQAGTFEQPATGNQSPVDGKPVTGFPAPVNASPYKEGKYTNKKTKVNGHSNFERGSPSRTVRDTSIPFAQEMEQAIARGTYKP